MPVAVPKENQSHRFSLFGRGILQVEVDVRADPVFGVGRAFPRDMVFLRGNDLHVETAFLPEGETNGFARSGCYAGKIARNLRCPPAHESWLRRERF